MDDVVSRLFLLFCSTVYFLIYSQQNINIHILVFTTNINIHKIVLFYTYIVLYKQGNHFKVLRRVYLDDVNAIRFVRGYFDNETNFFTTVIVICTFFFLQ